MIGLIALFGLYLSIARHQDDPFPLRVRARRWIDLYASRDPVSNGPLARTLPASVSSEEVWNSNSLIADHTSYWSNREGFVSRVGMLALSIGQPPDDGDIEWARRGGRRREWRLGVKRRSDQLALGTIVCAVAGLRDRLPEIGEAVTRALEGVPIVFGGIGLLVTSAIAPIPAAAVATVAAAAVVLPVTQPWAAASVAAWYASVLPRQGAGSLPSTWAGAQAPSTTAKPSCVGLPNQPCCGKQARRPVSVPAGGVTGAAEVLA